MTKAARDRQDGLLQTTVMNPEQLRAELPEGVRLREVDTSTTSPKVYEHAKYPFSKKY